MDTTGFFAYPTLAAAPGSPPAPGQGFLPHASAAEWDAVLAATETLRYRPGEVVLTAGERDRAFYLLLDGHVEVGAATLAAPAVLGAAAFLDGRPRTATVRARGHAEVARMSWDACEVLAARDPRLGRAILAEVGREVADLARAAATPPPGWTG
jgi:CRP/FNR family cyclic AMP-dependent transcriptional regulator